MKTARLVVVGIAALAALGAAVMMARMSRPKQVVVQQAAPAPTLETVDVLVMAGDIPVGGAVQAKDLRWQPWPKDAAGATMIKRSEAPNAVEDISGSIARVASLSGEPVRRDKLIKGRAGFMSAILGEGKRALAINIDTRGANTAGNFILPNDRVDIIRTYRDEDPTKAGAETFASETILRNVRVLAIGRNVQEQNGERVVTGETATLELDPRQTEVVALAQRSGQLALALRSMVDADKPTEPDSLAGDGTLSVVRFGISQRK
jgi:pilus assembly protein CpaB